MTETHPHHQSMAAAPLPSRRPLPFSRSAVSVAAPILLVIAALAGCRPAGRPSGAVPATRAPEHRIVPAPVSFALNQGEPFRLDSTSSVVVSNDAEVARTGEMLAALLRPATAYAIPVVRDTMKPASIALRLRPGATGEEYELSVTRDSVRITGSAAGIFRGMQTLRQLLPPAIESDMKVDGAWTVPAVTIADRPRFSWRGSMLDVARHFFTVDEVKQFIDLLALYKLNVLHLHLADDQGWRIEIKSRPKLAAMGGATQVGGGPGGFYTQADYAEIVRYAAERYISIVPEIDMPGHTNAALIAHPEVSCSRIPPALYTGTEVGWSTFCPDKEETYALIDDIIRELAALTPGRYIHVGGDEVEVLTHEQYIGFVERVQDIVARHGKEMVGWEEIGKARLRATTLAQQWKSDSAVLALRSGAKLIMSPSPRTYFDMKYTNATELGLTWAALIEVGDAYNWDPATYQAGVTERDIVGVEGPIWSETLRNITAVQYLAVPRLPALAEVGWSPQSMRDWESFRVRIAAHAPRWNYLGVNYYRSPQVPW
jgi:hexosaminidase